MPHLLPKSAAFAALPPVQVTDYLVDVLEWTGIRALTDQLNPSEQPLGVQAEPTADKGRQLTFAVKAADDAAAPTAVRPSTAPDLTSASPPGASWPQAGHLQP
ncbi:hypothetical protein [Geodermatophilus sp. URMC 62]|uniref:hypothetical protein n=1 Tax=Geodermatophilus sp. URMC 62 TaxID=3423414 RepID=UPI00406D3DC3